MSALTGCALAANQSWTGQISDSKCGQDHAQMITTRNKELRTSSGSPDRDCTLACVKEGAKYVFVVKGKVYQIANQNMAALQTNAGQPVRVTGNLQGDSITVSSVVKPATAK